MDIIQKVSEIKIIPVVKLDRPEDAEPLAEALCAGGLPAAEITFRTAAAEESIRTIAKAYPDMIVGAGTVLSAEQARRAVDAGAQFLVTPGFSRSVTEFAVDKGIPIIPGVCTPTELMYLLEYNLNVAKFFPAGQYGGLATIKALAPVFPTMRFVPTGGINESNVMEYLSFNKVIACGGSWMVKDSVINAGEFDKITRLTRNVMTLVKGV